MHTAATAAIPPLPHERRRHRLSVQRADALRHGIEAFADLIGKPVATLTGAGRDRDAYEARRLFYAIARRRGYSAAEIGRAVGRDHGTVLHALEKPVDLPAWADDVFAEPAAPRVHLSRHPFEPEAVVATTAITGAAAARIREQAQALGMTAELMISEAIRYLSRDDLFAAVIDAHEVA
jgi:hypothetical protein